MESTSRRAHRDSRSTHPEHGHDANARWNWWIINHGSLIAAAMTVLALSMLAVFVIHDRRTTTSPLAQQSNTPGTPTALTLPPLAVTSAISIDITPTTEPLIPPSVPIATVTTPPTAVPASAAVDTIAVAAIPAVTADPTTLPLSAAPSVTRAEPAAAASTDVARGLPHLQLALPATWVQVSRHVTSRDPDGAASSFQWVGPNGAAAVLQVAATGRQPTTGKVVTVRGHEAVLTTASDQITLQWPEPGGYSVALRLRGISETEAIALANKAVVVGDADWSQLLQRARFINPPAWDRILTDDW